MKIHGNVVRVNVLKCTTGMIANAGMREAKEGAGVGHLGPVGVPCDSRPS